MDVRQQCHTNGVTAMCGHHGGGWCRRRLVPEEGTEAGAVGRCGASSTCLILSVPRVSVVIPGKPLNVENVRHAGQSITAVSANQPLGV